MTPVFVARDRERPAVVAPDGALAWGELLDRARGLASRLGASRAPIVLYGHKQPALVVGVVAALRLGRPYVPIESSTPAARIAAMLAAARPSEAVLAEEPPPAVTGVLGAHGVATIALDPLARNVAAAAYSSEPAPIDPEAPAYIVFTSGTTGAPKGVPVPYRALDHFTDWLLATHAFVPSGEVFLNQAPFAFDLSVMDLYGALTTGGTLFAIAREEIADPRRLFRRLDGAPVTVWVSTPSFARFCLAEPRFSAAMLPALRRFLFCGETLPAGVARDLLARFPAVEVWNMYGPTETTVAVTAVRVTAEMAGSGRPLPVGWPAPGIQVWIADPEDPTRRLAAGAQGEIVVAGPQVASGYLAGAAETAGGPFFALGDGLLAYRTGDLGSIDPIYGWLACAGRVDRQIKLHGHRLELEEIEAHLRGVPGVEDAAVLPIVRDGTPDHLVAVVVGEAPLPDEPRHLTRVVRTALAEWLPDYALPRFVRRLPALPLTVNGKVDRNALREKLA